jgi:hypothetical protein
MNAIYDINTFETILQTGFEYKLPSEVITCLTSLHTKCSYTLSPYKQISFKKILFNTLKPIGIDNPDIISASTEMRLALNKITYKSYLTNIDQIVNIFVSVSETERSELENTMMEIFTSNRFYAKLYADIFATCWNTRPSFMNCFKSHYESFISSFNTIVYVNPDTDYDLFCKNNLIQEKQKTFSCFMLNLTLNEVVSKEYINNMVYILAVYIDRHMNSSEYVYIIDEMIENIVLCYNTKLFVESNIKFVAKISTYKPKQFAGISSKTIFKLMDII